MRREWASVLATGIVIAWVGASKIEARDLAFDERVAAQSAIERAYFQHRIGSRRTFEQAFTQEVLQGKVRAYLAKSAALERLWNASVTASMLEREIEHIARGSQMPDRLQEL